MYICRGRGPAVPKNMTAAVGPGRGQAGGTGSADNTTVSSGAVAAG